MPQTTKSSGHLAALRFTQWWASRRPAPLESNGALPAAHGPSSPAMGCVDGPRKHLVAAILIALSRLNERVLCRRRPK
jgi:hypothetical protein